MRVLYLDKNNHETKENSNLLNFYAGIVATYTDAVEAWDIYQKSYNNNDYYDIVFIDYELNYMNHTTLSHNILTLNSKQKIIILTQQKTLHFMKSFIDAGVANFLLKPIDETQLVDMLNIMNFSKKENNVLSMKHNHDVEKNMFFDLFTGLPNRTKLYNDITKHSIPIIILIDIDKLSIINEVYGLKAGNQAIKDLSLFLKEFAKNNNYYVYRVSDDEFVLADCVEVLDIFKYKKDLSELFDRIRDFKIIYNETEISIDATAGISIAQENPLETANTALNHAKSIQKEYIVYSNILNKIEEKRNDFKWKDMVRNSIENKKVVTVFQAITDQNKKVIKYETLMRLKDENDNLVSPFYFMDIAIKTKQYDTISKMIILSALNSVINVDKSISINLTYTDILNYQLVSEMEKFITQKKIGKQLVFEIVENENIKDYDILTDFINTFRRLGVKIAIDDFGSGFSNFEYILKIRPEYLKIDGSIIQKITQDEDSRTLVESIVHLSHKLNIKVIAEFVSNKEIFEILKVMKVDEYQGYYLHKPEHIDLQFL